MCKKCKDAGLVKHSDEMQLEASPEHHPGKRKRRAPQLRKHRIACRTCGVNLGFVETMDGPWSSEWIQAVSKKFGMKFPLCHNCLAKRVGNALR